MFYRQIVAELRKVIWPTRRELITYTTVVIVFVAVLTVFVSILDGAFGRLVLWVFGERPLRQLTCFTPSTRPPHQIRGRAEQ